MTHSRKSAPATHRPRPTASVLDHLEKPVLPILVLFALAGLVAAFLMVRAIDPRLMPPPAPLDGSSAAAVTAVPAAAAAAVIKKMARPEYLREAEAMVLHPAGRPLPADYPTLAYRNTGAVAATTTAGVTGMQAVRGTFAMADASHADSGSAPAR